MSDVLSSPKAIPYLFGLPQAEREELADIVHAFSGYAVKQIRTRMEALLYRTGERRIHRAVKKVLPSAGDQFLYFTAQAYASGRDCYRQRIGEQYLQLCDEGSVQDRDTVADANVLTNIATAQLLSREVLEHLQIPGLRRLDRMHELEERPDTSRDFGWYLLENVPHLKARQREKHYRPGV